LNSNKQFNEAYPALIRKVTANAKELIFEGSYAKSGKLAALHNTIFDTVQNINQMPVLRYDQNALMFEFAATSFENLAGLRFQHQLEGFDKDWSSWDSTSSKGIHEHS
jgi:hypothetical protein